MGKSLKSLLISLFQREKLERGSYYVSFPPSLVKEGGQEDGFCNKDHCYLSTVEPQKCDLNHGRLRPQELIINLEGYFGWEEKVKKIVILAIVIALLLPVLTACTGGTATITTTPTFIMILPPTTTNTPTPTPTPNAAGEIEATVFQGTSLTPIAYQRNNALAGTQYIDRATYTLTVDGLVDHPLTLTYNDLLALPQYDRLMPLNCVEGWNFTAKWTGPSLKDILAKAGAKPEGKILIFYTTDDSSGYSSLDMPYIIDNDIIIALKDNDITLPPERGFPFQVVAMSKYGYKWAKWVTRIEVSDNTSFRGYWENFGYNNNGDDKGPPFDK